MSDDWAGILDPLLAGDRLAFLKVNRLITGCLTQLRAYDHREEWDDLRQEVLIALVESARAGRLRDAQRFVAYVRTITRNKFFDRLSTAARRKETKTVEWNEEIAGKVEQASDGRLGEVWFTVEKLPDQERLVLQGVYREGKTYQQVADATGIPLGTVKRRLRDGLEKLRAELIEGNNG
jgi:RNA polymerase sigma-70 factor (ECF subfamily)